MSREELEAVRAAVRDPKVPLGRVLMPLLQNGLLPPREEAT